MNSLRITRLIKENKSKTVSLRLTSNQFSEIDHLKKELNFKTTTDLLYFSINLLKKLYEWHLLDYHFYIGTPEKKNLKEVEIEF